MFVEAIYVHFLHFTNKQPKKHYKETPNNYKETQNDDRDTKWVCDVKNNYKETQNDDRDTKWRKKQLQRNAKWLQSDANKQLERVTRRL